MSDPTPRVSRVFRHQRCVEADAIDALGHVSNVRYIQWIQDVAAAHSTAEGYGYERYLSEGLVFVVRRHEIDYLKPAFEGEELELCTWIERWSAATSVRRTLIERAGELCARASTTWALVSVDSRRPCRIPAELRQAFAEGDG